MIYLDSCALVKLIREEAESAGLQRWLDDHVDELHVTSGIARAEVVRAVRRNNSADDGTPIDPEALQRELAAAIEVLDAVAQIAVDDDILDRTGSVAAPTVRTLDAIHLVSATELDPSHTDFVTYDARLARAAADAGLRIAAPG